MKKAFYIGLGICALGVITLGVAVYAFYMTGGTRLLYENSTWGAYWRHYLWIFLAAGVLLLPGLLCLKAGYVPKEKRPDRSGVKAAAKEKAQNLLGAVRSAAPVTSVPSGWVCPNCGQVNGGGLAVCKHCGCKPDDGQPGPGES